MRKLMILQGLPASGKSTYARNHVDAHTVVVSMDGIRRMLVAGGNVQETYYRSVRHNHPRIERDVVDMYRMMCARFVGERFRCDRGRAESWKGLAGGAYRRLCPICG